VTHLTSLGIVHPQSSVFAKQERRKSKILGESQEPDELKRDEEGKVSAESETSFRQARPLVYTYRVSSAVTTSQENFFFPTLEEAMPPFNLTRPR